MTEPGPVEGLDLLGNGLIRIVVLQAGDSTKPFPAKGDVADVEILKVLVEDEDHPCPRLRTFRLGDGDECDALELVVPRMRPGEQTAVRSVPAAFGLDAALCRARPGAEVKAVVRLLRSRGEPPVAARPLAERRAEAERKRERGKWLFGREEFHAAAYSFNLGASYIAEACHRHVAEAAGGRRADGSAEEVSDEAISLCCTLYTNLALAQLQAGGQIPGSALETSEAALALQPRNAKAWYLKAKAHLAAGPVTEKGRQAAVSALEQLLVLEPGNQKAEELLLSAKDMAVSDEGSYAFMSSRPYQWMVTGLLLATMPVFFRMVKGDVGRIMFWLNDTAPEGMLADDVSL